MWQKFILILGYHEPEHYLSTMIAILKSTVYILPKKTKGNIKVTTNIRGD